MDKEASRTAISAVLDLARSEALHDYGSYTWDILSALRGPDYVKENFIPSVRLKELTTARVRAVIGVKEPVCGWALHSPLTPAEQEEREALLTHASPHFQNHYFNAVEAIKVIYGYDLWNERKIPEV